MKQSWWKRCPPFVDLVDSPQYWQLMLYPMRFITLQCCAIFATHVISCVSICSLGNWSHVRTLQWTCEPICTTGTDFVTSSTWQSVQGFYPDFSIFFICILYTASTSLSIDYLPTCQEIIPEMFPPSRMNSWLCYTMYDFLKASWQRTGQVSKSLKSVPVGSSWTGLYDAPTNHFVNCLPFGTKSYVNVLGYTDNDKIMKFSSPGPDVSNAPIFWREFVLPNENERQQEGGSRVAYWAWARPSGDWKSRGLFSPRCWGALGPKDFKFYHGLAPRYNIGTTWWNKTKWNEMKWNEMTSCSNVAQHQLYPLRSPIFKVQFEATSSSLDRTAGANVTYSLSTSTWQRRDCMHTSRLVYVVVHYTFLYIHS